MTSRLGAGHPPSAADERPYGVLDVETDGLRGPLLHWTATCEHRRAAGLPPREGRTADELWHVLVSGNSHGVCSGRDHTWWAHNGGNYDYIYLLPPARDDVAAGAVVVPITRADAIIGWRVARGQAGHRHRTDLRDSYALLPAPLQSLAEAFAPELPKGDIGLADGVTFDPDNPEHRAYAARDSDALLAVLTGYRAILAERFGTLPSWSAAGTAMRAWRGMLAGASFAPPPQAAADLARAGYFGGMVRVGSLREHADMVTIDVNSMYPYVMRLHGVPDGHPTPARAFRRGRPGFYRVRITVPRDEPWTFVPYRDPAGVLAWPTGTFETVVSSDELARAQDRGYRFDVFAGWTWPRLAYPFGLFVDAVESLRAEGGAASVVGKITGNGLYGKFGSRPTHDDWQMATDRPGPDWYPPAFDAADPVAAEAYRGLWVRRDQPINADYLRPDWAAWITAHARLTLAAYADAIGPEAVVYADTDSLTFPATRLDRVADRLGPAFGRVKIEHDWRTFRAIAPKVYTGVERCHRTGRHEHGKAVYDGPHDLVVRKAKGIPRELISEAFDTPETAVRWLSPTGSLQVLRGAPMRLDRTRRLSSLAGSLAWRSDDGEHVRPVHLDGGGS